MQTYGHTVHTEWTYQITLPVPPLSRLKDSHHKVAIINQVKGSPSRGEGRFMRVRIPPSPSLDMPLHPTGCDVANSKCPKAMLMIHFLDPKKCWCPTCQLPYLRHTDNRDNKDNTTERWHMNPAPETTSHVTASPPIRTQDHILGHKARMLSCGQLVFTSNGSYCLFYHTAKCLPAWYMGTVR